MIAGNEAIVLAREPVLLELRIERGEGVLPPPDHQRPDERSDAADNERGAENTKNSSHPAPSTTEAGIPAKPRDQSSTDSAFRVFGEGDI